MTGSAHTDGAGSQDVSDSKSSLSAAKGTKNSARASSIGNSSSRMKVSYPAIWLSLLLVVFTAIPVAIWTFIKSARDNGKAARQNEIAFQSLDTEQILGKIASK